MEYFSIEKTLAREILLSEKLRAKLLASTFLFAIVMLLVMRLFFIDFALKFFPDASLIYISQAILAAFIIRETAVIKVIENRLAADKGVDLKIRLFSNLIEASYPTILLAVLGIYLKSIIVLFTPVVYFYFLALILSTLSLDFRISFYSGITAAIGYMLMYLLYRETNNEIITSDYLTNEILHVFKATLFVVAGAIAGLVANQIKKNIVRITNVQSERNKIMNMFGQQVSSSVVDELLDNDNKIKSVERYVCVMFLDIRGFTQIVENKKPEEIITYQNNVFGFMIDIITKHHGIINQFMGDGYMATFGVPLSKGNDSQNAVAAALEIIDALNEKNDQGVIPVTRIGIGLHSGLVIAGNVGTDKRKQYSVSGNAVITAARLEQLNKEYKSQLLISKEVKDNVDTTNLEPKVMGSVVLKGRGAPIEIWQLA